MTQNDKIPANGPSTHVTAEIAPGRANVQFSLTTTEGTKPVATRPPKAGGKDSKGGKKGT